MSSLVFEVEEDDVDVNGGESDEEEGGRGSNPEQPAQDPGVDGIELNRIASR